MFDRKRYALVGLGIRSKMYTEAMLGDFSKYCELVGLCDSNEGRLLQCRNGISNRYGKTISGFDSKSFDNMIISTRPDTVLVTTGPDSTHDSYICRALELGCNVITEKPMTIDEDRCRRIIKAVEKSGKSIKVTFNYRYSPPRSQIKEILMAGEIGEILSVDFQWFLDTKHGANYYRRWHRLKQNSGSLLVHKATHHFDLVNWFLNDIPQTVFCQASLSYYTPENAEKRGLHNRGQRCRGCGEAKNCKFYLDIESHQELKELYLDCEHYDGYIRDRCVFSDEIDIWDNMAVNVRYKKGTLLSYMLYSYSPYEGYRIAFNGTKGRLEHGACEDTYVSGDGSVPGALNKNNVYIRLISEFSKPREIKVRTGEGGHGGGDPVLLADLFDPNDRQDTLGRKANHLDGAYSILVGIAASKSANTQQMVRIADLLN